MMASLSRKWRRVGQLRQFLLLHEVGSEGRKPSSLRGPLTIK
jgi:hypothetical protein